MSYQKGLLRLFVTLLVLMSACEITYDLFQDVQQKRLLSKKKSYIQNEIKTLLKKEVPRKHGISYDELLTKRQNDASKKNYDCQQKIKKAWKTSKTSAQKKFCPQKEGIWGITSANSAISCANENCRYDQIAYVALTDVMKTEESFQTYDKLKRNFYFEYYSVKFAKVVLKYFLILMAIVLCSLVLWKLAIFIRNGFYKK